MWKVIGYLKKLVSCYKLKVTENCYSGIPTMKKECHEKGLPEPEFKVLHEEFTVIFRNNIYNPEKEMFKKQYLSFS